MKSSVKLFFSLFITALLSLGSTQDLTLWHYWDGANGEVLQGLIDQYEEANPGVTIESVFVPGGELTSKLQAAIAGRQTPSMAISDLVAMPLLTSSGVLAPLDDYIAASDTDMNDYFEGPLVYGMRDGQRYSLPVSASNLGLFWNKEIFEEAGLDPNTPPQTWDELLEMSKTIKEQTGKWGYEDEVCKACIRPKKVVAVWRATTSITDKFDDTGQRVCTLTWQDEPGSNRLPPIPGKADIERINQL